MCRNFITQIRDILRGENLPILPHSSAMVRLKTRVIWKKMKTTLQSLQIEKLNNCVRFRFFVTITARLRIRRPCSSWERRTVFFLPEIEPKLPRATFLQSVQPAFNRGQPNPYLKYVRMSYVSVPYFVNLGPFSTKRDFAKLRWCLHRHHGKCPLIRQSRHRVVLPCYI